MPDNPSGPEQVSSIVSTSADGSPVPTTTTGPGLPRDQIPGVFEQSMLMMNGFVPDPIASKLTDAHISNLISNDENSNKRTHTLTIVRIVALVVVLVLVLGFVLAFCYLFSTKSPELVEKVLIGAIGFAGGIGAGLGGERLFGRIKKDD